MSFFGRLYSSTSLSGRIYYSTGLVAPWTPDQLFAQNEVGAWYDPSDLTTLFQDTAGTTPVTAAGQRVALMLDKSRGLVLGPELATGTPIAYTANGTVSVSGGVITCTCTTNGNYGLSFGALATNNRRYLVTFDVVTNSAARTLFGWASLNGDALNAGGTIGAKTGRLAATTGSTVIAILSATAGESFSVSNISVRELPGNHATQATLAQRPTYQVDANGKPHLFFDGIDDGMLTGTITPGADKAQVFAGVRKLSDAARGTIAELTASAAANNGAFHLTAPNAASTTFAFESKGTTLTDAVVTGIAAPATRLLTGLGDIAGDTATLRVNGVQADQDTGDQGTGNYAAAVLYLGRRGGTTLPFSGHLYGAIVRFSAANLAAAQIAATERWMNSKTGAF